MAVTVPLQVLFMVLAPLALGFWLVRRGYGTWKLFFAGALAFAASQVVHIPLLVGLTKLVNAPFAPVLPKPWTLPFNAVVLGLAAGACEEPARWLVLRLWMKQARGTRAALVFGAGHGGIESILFGALAAVNFVAMSLLRVVDPTRLGVHADQLAKVHQAVDAYWAGSPAMPLVGAGERAMAVTIHLAASVLVMRGVVTGRRRWLALAILFHAAVDGAAVYVVGRFGALAGEAAVLPFVALAALVLLLGRERPAAPAAPRPAASSA